MHLPFSTAHLLSWTRSHVWLVLLTAIVVTVAAINYNPATWLTGWDTLHPEFDFGLNIERTLLGSWRADQGLGTLAIHAHMSDLPRILVMWLAALVLPLHTVKYLYVLACLILGPLGIYWLLSKKLLRGHDFAAPASIYWSAVVPAQLGHRSAFLCCF
jgi:hypothetical protein